MSKEELRMADATTMDIQRVITNLFNETGIVKQLTVNFPRSCLTEILTILSKHESQSLEDLRFQLNVYTNYVNLTFFNK